MKLLGSSKSKVTKDENDENVPRLESNGVVLVHCSIVNYDYHNDLRVLYTFFSNKSVIYYIFHQKNYIFKSL